MRETLIPEAGQGGPERKSDREREIEARRDIAQISKLEFLIGRVADMTLETRDNRQDKVADFLGRWGEKIREEYEGAVKDLDKAHPFEGAKPEEAPK